MPLVDRDVDERHWRPPSTLDVAKVAGKVSRARRAPQPRESVRFQPPEERHRGRSSSLDEHAALHDAEPGAVLEDGDVAQGIAVDDHEIGELAGLERPDAVLHAHELGAVPGGAGDRLERREADDVDEDLDVLRVLAVRVPGESKVAAGAHADPEVPGA